MTFFLKNNRKISNDEKGDKTVALTSIKKVIHIKIYADDKYLH